MNRQGFEITANLLGEVCDILDASIGSTSKTSIRNSFECLYSRLKGSQSGFNLDQSLGMLPQQTLEPIGLGLLFSKVQGATRSASAFPDTGTWYPLVFGPPSQEGWGNWGYNAWASYTPVDENGDEFLSHNSLMVEPSPEDRLEQSTAVRWNGSAYSPIAHFQSGMWVSFENTSGSTITSTGTTLVSVTIPKLSLQGCLQTNPATDIPIDIRFYGSLKLVQTFASTWQPLASTPSQNEAFDALDFVITSVSSSEYKITVKLPNGYSIPDGDFLHILALFGTKSSAFTSGLNVTDACDILSSTTGEIECDATLWPKKCFFSSQLNDALSCDLLSYNANQGRIVDDSHRNFGLIDGIGSVALTDSYYVDSYFLRPEIANSIAISSLDEYEAVPISVYTTNQSIIAYTEEDVYAISNLAIGDPIPHQFQPASWDDFDFWPNVPEGSSVVARCVVALPPSILRQAVFNDSGTVAAVNTLASASVLYLKSVVDTFARTSLNDSLLFLNVYGALYDIIQWMRSTQLSAPVRQTTCAILTTAAGMNEEGTRYASKMSNPDGQPSKLFHTLIKQPIQTQLRDASYMSSPLSFDSHGESLISKTTGTPPVIEFARLSSNKLEITRSSPLVTESYFEIAHTYSPQCANLSPQSSGTQLGRDYAFRMTFVDVNGNQFTKDLEMMASKYFLSDSEYTKRQSSGLSMSGYFKLSTLQDIDIYAEFSTAALIPDSSMNKSSLILCKKPLIHSNKFMKLHSLTSTISYYAFGASPWMNNIRTKYQVRTNPDGLRADSFTVAQANLSPEALENWGTGSQSLLSTPLDNTSKVGQYAVLESSLAIPISMADSDIKIDAITFNMRMRLTSSRADFGTVSNPYHTMYLNIYSNVDGNPGSLLATSLPVLFKDISVDALEHVAFPVAITLLSNTSYWLVLEPRAIVGGQLLIEGDGVIDTHVIQDSSDFYDDSSGWDALMGRASLITYNSGTIVNDYSANNTQLTVIQGKTGILIPSQASPINSVSIAINKDASVGSGELSFSLYTVSANQPSSLLPITIEPLSYGDLESGENAVTINFSANVSALTPVFLIATMDKVPAEGALRLATKDTSSTALSMINGEWTSAPGSYYHIGSEKTTVQILGAFNRDDPFAESIFPKPSRAREIVEDGYTVVGHTSMSTALLVPPQPISIYPRYVFEDTWFVAKRSRDIPYCLRYVVDGETKTIKSVLPQSSGWKTQWWKRGVLSYLDFDSSLLFNKEEALDEIDLAAYEVDGSTEYFNGKVSGSFSPVYNEAYTLEIIASKGFRLYVDNVMVADEWDRESLTPFEYSLGTLSTANSVKIEILTWHNTGSYALEVRWSSATQVKALLSTASSGDQDPVVITINEPVEKIVYLSVADSVASFNTPTQDAPPGDLLSFRSS